MQLTFTKMHGLGNDFVVIDGTRQKIALSPERIRLLADRHFGVGCDQVLLVEPPQQAGVDFRYRIFNADGGEVAQCGNGVRCFARFVLQRGLTNKREFSVETNSGIVYPRIEERDQVSVNMGVPQFEPKKIPFLAETRANSYELDVGDQRIVIGAVSMGNPHAVLRVDNVNAALVSQLGAIIERHPRFPERVNVGFMEIVTPGHIRLRVFERGAGETLACGTGACAAVAVGRQAGLLDDMVKVDLPGGQLTIAWAGSNEPVWMTGPATFVFEGTIEL